MSKFRILIVDDEEDVRTIQRLALSLEHEIVEAHDGLDALEKLERVEPDFVILDVMMPLMDGFETCRAIRKHPKYYDIPVLFVSAKRDRQAIEEGYQSGANLYLTKPFDPDRLLKNVNYYFSEHEAVPRAKRYTLEQLEMMKEEDLTSVSAQRQSQEDPFVEEKPPEPVRAVPVASAEPEPAGPAKPRLMIIDDSEEIIEMLRITLQRDFEITCARNGLDGVERIILYQPDLIVLDALLPKMSGYQLCTSIRRNRNYRRTPIIFISAKASEKDQEYCRRLGASDFIPKPFDPQTLKQRLVYHMRAPHFHVRPKKLSMADIEFRERSEGEWQEERQVRAEARRDAAEYQRLIEGELQ